MRWWSAPDRPATCRGERQGWSGRRLLGWPSGARSRWEWIGSGGGRGAGAGQGRPELLLGVLGEGGLQDAAAVFAQGGDGLVRRHLLGDQEQRGGAGLLHVLDVLLKPRVDPDLVDRPEE